MSNNFRLATKPGAQYRKPSVVNQRVATASPIIHQQNPVEKPYAPKEPRAGGTMVAEINL